MIFISLVHQFPIPSEILAFSSPRKSSDSFDHYLLKNTAPFSVICVLNVCISESLLCSGQYIHNRMTCFIKTYLFCCKDQNLLWFRKSDIVLSFILIHTYSVRTSCCGQCIRLLAFQGVCVLPRICRQVYMWLRRDTSVSLGLSIPLELFTLWIVYEVIYP